jgi:glucosamine--fructose-6-phosphate aminotransferase (isomerizing)
MSLMLSEIIEQPDVLARTLVEEKHRVTQFAAKLRQRDIRLIATFARGSSDNAAMYGRYLLEIRTGIPVSDGAPSVHTIYKAKLNLRDALVIGVSQSGESTDINLVLESAKKSGAITVAITNEADSTMARLADETFLIHAGRERSVAATKTYTGQMLIFHLLANALGEIPVGENLEQLPELTQQSLSLQPQITELVQQYTSMQHCAVVGRGMNYGNALELSIKLMETCYVIAHRFSSAEFMHGPIAMVGENFPVFLFAPPGLLYESTKSLVIRLNELGATTCVISSEDEILHLATHGLKIPVQISEFLSPIPYIIPGQMFTALLAEARGLNPDQPRSISKVTKTV